MANPTINFRISPYQLARGLQIVRQLEPDYKLTSLSKLVKTIYMDYIAKMSLNKTNNIPQHYLDEVEGLIYHLNKPIRTFNEFTKENYDNLFNQDEKSIKSTVEDFSPPEDWEK